jgi:outer membrane protein
MSQAKEKREGILWLLLAISLVIGIYTITNLPDAQKETAGSLHKAGYVDVTTVFSKFEMKKELQKKLEKELFNKQSVIDSLMFQLQSLSNELSAKEKPSEVEIAKFQSLQQYYAQQKQTFDAYSQELTGKYDDQILSQMSQYIKDFGMNNGYDYVFGATGNGSILYGNELNDVTEEVILYINKSYQGIN